MQTTINKALITLKKFNKKDTSFIAKNYNSPHTIQKQKKSCTSPSQESPIQLFNKGRPQVQPAYSTANSYNFNYSIRRKI